MQCAVCGGKDWLELPTPHHNRSVRSDGSIVNIAIEKKQCAACALVQAQTIPSASTLEHLYSAEYDIYNNRPGAEKFIGGRYMALARSIAQAAFSPSPQRVLEVGCGNGSALQAIQAVWPDAECVGLEPVASAVQLAQSAGINVHQGMIGRQVPDSIAKVKYDVIYTVHVIEHTASPAAFLNALKDMLEPNGQLIITCPDAHLPNLEITRADHNYSMLPFHLCSIARQAGLLPVRYEPCPGGADGVESEYNQLVVCGLPGSEDKRQVTLASIERPGEFKRRDLFSARTQYLSKFSALEGILQRQISRTERLFCFGAGGWASILAGYAPALWQQVEACVIDGGSEHLFHGKPIVAYERLKQLRPQHILVGTSPAVQPAIVQRLQMDGFHAISWNQVIPA